MKGMPSGPWAVVVMAVLAAAVACGSNDKSPSTAPASTGSGDSGAPPPYEAVCEATAPLPCSHQTVDSCGTAEKAVGVTAASAGCTKEWLATLDCRKAHPDTCSGAALLQDEACRPAKDALDACERGGSDPCASPRDACTRCQCQTCPCDATCLAAQQSYADCNRGCAAAVDKPACFAPCEAAVTPDFQAHVNCYANSCAAECGTAP